MSGAGAGNGNHRVASAVSVVEAVDKMYVSGA